MSIGTKRVEDYIPVIKYNEGFYTELDFTIASGATVTLPSTTTIGGSAVVALGDITSSSTTATAFTVTNTGIFVGTGGVVAITANTATSPTSIFVITANGITSGGVQLITSSGTLVTTASLLTLTANSATTAAGLLRINANGLTDGIGLIIASSATATTSTGRLFKVSHTGATSTSGIIGEVASAATDETVVFQVTASGALAAGVALKVSGAAVTTGSLISAANADGLTTGTIATFKSNSADVTARNLVLIHNDNTAAVGAVPLTITQDAVVETNFKILFKAGGVTFFVSDGTAADANLTGTKGDICFAQDTTKVPAYCDADGKNWTALA